MKPTDSYYAKVGLFMSYPQATSTDNHGLAFGPDPNQNGLFVIGETGFTPKIGAPKSAESFKEPVPAKKPKQYSFYNIESLQQRGTVKQPNYTCVLEVDYRLQINKWAYLQPYIQYIIQPNGTGAIENATILGFMTGSDPPLWWAKNAAAGYPIPDGGFGFSIAALIPRGH